MPTQQEIMRGPHHYDPIEKTYVSDGPIPPPLDPPKMKPEDIVKGTHHWDPEKRQYVAGERPGRKSAYSGDSTPVMQTPIAEAVESKNPARRPCVKQHIEQQVLDEMTPAKRAKVSR